MTEQELQTENNEIAESITEGIDQVQELEDAKKSNDFKLFDLYDVSEIKVVDPGMRRYINLEPKLVVKSQGRIRKKFSRGKINILELLANLIAVPGHRGKKHKIQTGWKAGKYSQNMRIVLKCLKIVEEKTKQNPVQVLVTAVENAAPRDGVTVIEYGGARYPQAVDVSPVRRVTMTLRMMVQGSYDKSFNKKTKIEQALADELIKAFNNDMDSFAMGRKRDSEKQADSAR
ncbi:30S ribosomal protein S7 [archaeon]|jgi:small subunit ribosomal protein S7|nr:30S ribosomal protein S7 [archaeon]MBT4241546.1 30S ribosomal protein S7 [archaeon]MBT4417582.1 30S ribosomal protein S7 [archaeon]